MSTPTIAFVCASNQNRSMAAHNVCKDMEGVYSYGTGDKVKLPGKSRMRPNTYDFGIPYQYMIDDLTKKDPEYYEKIGLIKMLKRNAAVKKAPEKYQLEPIIHDVVFSFDNRAFDEIMLDLTRRMPRKYQKPVHVVNMNTPDRLDDAETAALFVREFIETLQEYEDWEHDIYQVVQKFNSKNYLSIQHISLFI